MVIFLCYYSEWLHTDNGTKCIAEITRSVDEMAMGHNTVFRKVPERLLNAVTICRNDGVQDANASFYPETLQFCKTVME
jgi:hypothetical protein